MNANDPPDRGPEINPYVPPEAPIDEAVAPGLPDDLAEAEAIRRTYLGHEALVKSIGSLHYLGVVFGFGMIFYEALSPNRKIGGGVN